MCTIQLWWLHNDIYLDSQYSPASAQRVQQPLVYLGKRSILHSVICDLLCPYKGLVPEIATAPDTKAKDARRGYPICPDECTLIRGKMIAVQ